MRDIVIVTGSMSHGGAEGVISTISNQLCDRGWNVHIVTVLKDMCDYDLAEGIDYRSLAQTKKVNGLGTLKLMFSLRRFIKDQNPNAVLSFMVRINILTFFATRGLKLKFYPSERNDPSKGRSRIIKLLQLITYSFATETIFQTTRAKNYFPKSVKEHSVVIPNPINETPFQADRSRKRIVAVGRLTEQKNHKLLIDAFRNIHKDFSDFMLDIYGDGPLRKELQDLIDNMELKDCVHLCGKVDNVPEAIRDAYMFVLSSDYEGLSNALLEAMQLGLPCITTDCAGSDDAIQDGENGLIVPIRDKDALERAIRKLIEKPEICTEMGSKAHASMGKYNVERVIDQWERVLS